ncbi:hypothetical protein [uncultured Friedmanniella sp.]|uniref:hypothetical protein n=1 Tax=uncultured Friedmanniella sp. TaxID=335381 RepID=UPI0035CA0FF0
MTVAGVVGHFAAWQTCRRAAAVRAVRYYLDTGGRDPELSWYGGRDVVEMRPDTLA